VWVVLTLIVGGAMAETPHVQRAYRLAEQAHFYAFPSFGNYNLLFAELDAHNSRSRRLERRSASHKTLLLLVRSLLFGHSGRLTQPCAYRCR
jgi:hypothetical protein